MEVRKQLTLLVSIKYDNSFATNWSQGTVTSVIRLHQTSEERKIVEVVAQLFKR